MLDLFGGVTAETVDQSNQAHVTNYLAIAFVLLEKGLITNEELDNARTKSVHFVEQEWARKKEAAQKEFDEEHPGTRKFMEKILGVSSDDDA